MYLRLYSKKIRISTRATQATPNCHYFFVNRVISYVSRAISNSLRRGDRHYNFPTVYSVNLLDFRPDEFPENDEYFWKVMLKDNANRIFSRKLLIFFFKLSNFAAQSTEKREHFENGMVKWLYYLKNIQNMGEQDMEKEEDPIFKKLLEECKYSNLNNMEQEEYKKSLLEYEGIRDAIECAREDAARENFEQGLQQGRTEGLAEGEAKGRAEEKLAMAKLFLEQGVDIEIITKTTGLTAEEVMNG